MSLAEKVATMMSRREEHFDFIDYLRPEKRRDRLRELDAKLIDALVSRDIDDAHLAAPQTLDWIDVNGFRFSSSGDQEDLDNDPRISAYLDTHDAATVDLELLKHDRLLALRGPNKR